MNSRGDIGYAGVAAIVVIMCVMVALSGWAVSYFVTSQEQGDLRFTDNTYTIEGEYSDGGLTYEVTGSGSSHYINESSDERILMFTFEPECDAELQTISVSLILNNSNDTPLASLYTNTGAESLDGIEYSVWVLTDTTNGTFKFLVGGDGVPYCVYVTIEELQFTARML